MHGASLVALAPAAHRRTAARADLAAVDRARQRAVRAHAGLQDTPRLLEQRGQRLVAEGAQRGPGVDPQGVQRLAADDVADARRDRLVEQDLADGPGAGRTRARTLDGDVDARVGIEQIRAEVSQGRVKGDAGPVEQLEHGPAELHGAGSVGAQRQPGIPRRATPRLALGVDVPYPGHAQVRMEDAAVLEGQEQMLAPRLDRCEHLAVERFREPVRRLVARSQRGHAMADERRHAQRRKLEGVPLGQGQRLARNVSRFGPAAKPAAVNAGAAGEAVAPSPSMRSSWSEPTRPSRDAVASASATAAQSSFSSGCSESSVRAPRSRNASGSPLRSTTVAPAAREARPAARAGQRRATPYGLAGSLAASALARASGAGSRTSRSRSIAPGSACCAPPRPSTR